MVKELADLIPKQHFSSLSYYLANILNSFSNMGYEIMLEDLVQTSKAYLD